MPNHIQTNCSSTVRRKIGKRASQDRDKDDILFPLNSINYRKLGKRKKIQTSFWHVFVQIYFMYQQSAPPKVSTYPAGLCNASMFLRFKWTAIMMDATEQTSISIISRFHFWKNDFHHLRPVRSRGEMSKLLSAIE